MNKYILHTKDLNNSLVFYRALFDKMPTFMSAYELVFELENFILKILESGDEGKKEQNPIHLDVTQIDLKKILNKMNRFLRLNQFKEDCEKPETTIGLMDPDGNKWIVGDYKTDISFEKCYINL